VKLRARLDSNHVQVADAFRRLGWHVISTARMGRGFPDLLVARHGVMKLIEIKDGAKVPSARKLTEDEEVFHRHMRRYGCPVIVIETIDQIDAL
jgi:hypothetical protein